LLCFEQNNYPGYETGGYLEVYVASLGDTATVTITSRLHPSLNKVFFLQANSSISYDISDDTIPGGGQMQDLWIVSDEVPDNTVVQVQATAPVVCYGLDYKVYTADAFCAISGQSAGTDYRVISYPNSNNQIFFSDNQDWMPSQFSVAAFEDNDTVTITPSAPTLGGHVAGVPFKVVLQQGQCVQVQTDAAVDGLDLTGSMVSATHPVTVYGSHARTEVPTDWQRPQADGGSVSRDMLLETMPPTSDWGDNFVLNAVVIDNKGTLDPNGTVMRVLALNDNTAVSVNGDPWVTLSHNQFKDSTIRGPVLVTSTGPLLVGEIEHTDYTTNSNGDPFLAIVPPVDQTYNNFTFFLGDSTIFNYQGVIIAADTSCIGSIVLDGTPLPRSFFKSVPGTVNGRAFAILDYPRSEGPHKISTTQPPEQGFTILAHGEGDVISYGYTAGSLLVPKRSIMIEYPPVTNRQIHTNTLNFHNGAYQPAYLDSATFIPDDFKNAAFGVHTAEDVALDIGRVDIGGSGQVHLVSDIPLNYPVSGTLNIYSHLPSYFNIEPAQMHFTLYPDAADVAQAGQTLLNLTASPNPFSAYTTINFTVPQTGDITVTLYDQLGRVVQHVASREFTAGPYSFQIERNGLPSGVYVCEVTSAQLNIHARIPIIAGE
jgi:hypothetical protein